MRILIPTVSTFELIDINQVKFIKAEGNYTRVNTCKKGSLLSLVKFGDFCKQLEGMEFIQTHKSFMVNVRHVVRFHKNGHVEMLDGKQVPVARRRRDLVLDNLSAIYQRM